MSYGTWDMGYGYGYGIWTHMGPWGPWDPWSALITCSKYGAHMGPHAPWVPWVPWAHMGPFPVAISISHVPYPIFRFTNFI